MNLDPTEEQRQIVATVRRFVREEIVPLEAKLDPDASELPREDFERLNKQVREMGFCGLDIPAEYGGAGIDLVTRTLMAVEMAQHRAGLYAPCYGVFGSAGLAQLYEATEEQKQRYLLSDAARREARLLRPDRALRRQRSRTRHPHARRQGRQRLDHQRLQGVHLGRGHGRLRHRLRPHGCRARAAAASPASSSTPT